MKQGFTLIELLVVVLIIGILAAIALPQYQKAVEKARAAEAIQMLGDLATAEQIYQMGMGSYTNDMTLMDIEMPGVSTDTSIATTKNFRVQITNADGANVFQASASRVNSTGAISTDPQYAITLRIDNQGVITRMCNKQAPTLGALSADTSDISKYCKAIANNSTGEIK